MRRILVLAATAALLAGLLPNQARAATTHTVFMSNFRFCNTPVCAANENVTIKVGDTVQWVFADPACAAIHAAGCFHTSTRPGTGANAWNSGSMPGSPPSFGAPSPKLMFSKTFGSTGTFAYVCTLHENTFPPLVQMKASVIVTT